MVISSPELFVLGPKSCVCGCAAAVFLAGLPVIAVALLLVVILYSLLIELFCSPVCLHYTSRPSVSFYHCGF